MFDPDQSVTAWRAKLLAAGLTDPAVLDELEAHLREDFAREVKSGLDETQAFALVVERIGSGPALKVEFRKVNILKRYGLRLFNWIFIGGMLLLIAADYLTELAQGRFINSDPYYIHAARWLHDWRQLFVWSWIIFAFIRNYRRSKLQPTVFWRQQFSLVPGVVLGMVVVISGLACAVMSAGLIYTGYLRDGLKGVLAIAPIAMIFFAGAGLIYYFCRRYIRAARARLVTLKQSSHA